MNMIRLVIFSHQILKENCSYMIQVIKLFIEQVYLIYRNLEQLTRYVKKNVHYERGLNDFNR